MVPRKEHDHFVVMVFKALPDAHFSIEDIIVEGDEE